MLPPSLYMIRKGFNIAFMPGVSFILKIISSLGLMLYITKYIGIEQNTLQTNLLELFHLPYIREIAIVSVINLLTNSITVSFVIPSLYIILRTIHPHISRLNESLNKYFKVEIFNDNIINIVLIAIIGLTLLYIHKNKSSYKSLVGPIIGIGLYILSLLFYNVVSISKAKDAIEDVLA